MTNKDKRVDRGIWKTIADKPGQATVALGPDKRVVVRMEGELADRAARLMAGGKLGIGLR